MFDPKSLDQLGPIADEMLGGLNADEKMRLAIKRTAAEGKTARRMPVKRYAPAVCCAALALALALFASPNAYLRGEKMENLAQHRLAQHIPAGASLLQYSHLDDGLYLAADTLPQQKYFVRLNVAYDDMRAELDRYAAEAIPEYVLVSWRPLPEQFDRYQLIAEDAGYDDEGRVNKALYLYRRK